MSIRKRVMFRMERTMCYWGLLKHPFGTDYVREYYTPTGKQKKTPKTAVEIPTVRSTGTDA